MISVKEAVVDRSTLKSVSLAVIVLVVGIALRSVDALKNTQAWLWSLGDLVSWASFTFAAATAAHLAGETAEATHPVRGSAALARLLGVAVFGVALWLLLTAVKSVVVSAWSGNVQKVFAFGLVALAAYAVFVAHRGFDEIAAALAPARHAGGPARTPASPATEPRGSAPAFCGKCGAAIPGENQFCGRCGTPRGASA
jgi:hypothetical protein